MLRSHTRGVLYQEKETNLNAIKKKLFQYIFHFKNYLLDLIKFKREYYRIKQL